jgi:hypothetical protein
MPVPDETLIAVRPEDFDYALENTEISQSTVFTWTDGTTKNAYGGSSSLGQCIVAVLASGWNACSESGSSTGGTVLRVMY